MLAMVLAAVLIQRVFRGHLQRSRGTQRPATQTALRHRRPTKQLDKYLAALAEYNQLGLPKPARLEIGYFGWCAVRIQVSKQPARNSGDDGDVVNSCVLDVDVPCRPGGG
jgi:hypothetical protein